jgi:hypothetical protein
MKIRTWIIFQIGLQLIALIASGQTWLSLSTTAKGSTQEVNVDVNAEYSNGTLGSAYQELALWYDWVNTSRTQLIFLAYYSYVVNPPIVTFLGQHYYTENNTEVFVGNTLTAMEIYNDTNGNGLPDADYSAGTTEILYSFEVNSSVSFDITPIEKTSIEGLPHYKWGIRYQTIDGFLNTENYSSNAKAIIDYIDFSYDFYIQNNVSYLKTNFGIGKILEISASYPDSNASISLQGLSLALFYGTAVITSKPYITVVNGNPYNSMTAPASVQLTDLSEIRIEDATAYEFVFGQNYKLFRDSGQETYESKSTAVSNQSVSGSLRNLEWVLSNMESVLSSLFPKISNIQTAIDLDYTVSSFLYRVCYPVWDGCKLQHDPTYKAHLGAGIVPELSPPIVFVIVAALVSTIAFIAAVIDLKKTRKMLRISPPVTSPT